MHRWIVSHWLSPGLERVLGRRTFPLWKELEQIQWWPATRTRDLQAELLGDLLRSAAAHCPYYRNLFGEHGVRPEQDDPFTNLALLPLLDKATVRANLDDLTNRDVPGGPIPFNTGGSTGEPLVFHVDRQRVACDKAARMLTHAWFECAPGDREVYLWGSPIELRTYDRIKRWRDRLTNEMLLSAFRLTPDNMQRYLAAINRFDPASIFGYPSSLAAFAGFCTTAGLRFAGRNLRAVFVTGELLDPQQRELLTRFFRADVADGYGSRDGGLIAHQCPAGRLHLLDPTHLLDIVDEQGHVLGPNQAGEIVVTHLHAQAMPLLRYRTGDVGMKLEGTCPCGRELGLLGMVAGRKTDHLVTADGTLTHALAAIYVVRELSTVQRFHIRQKRDRSVEVDVVPAAGFTTQDEEIIRTGIQRQLGGCLPVAVQVVASISASGSGKFRYVSSEAAEQACAWREVHPTRNTFEPAGQIRGGRNA